MRARDIMTSPVHTVRQNASVETAAEVLTAKAVTALPVVDANGQLIGMVSESDLLWHRVPAEPPGASSILDPDPPHRPRTVGEVMSPYPLAATSSTDVADVAEAMLDNDVRSIPVVDNRTIVGIVSRRDILRAMVRSDVELARDVQHRLDEYAGGRRWTATVEAGIATVAGTYGDGKEQAVVTLLARTVPGVATVRVTARRAVG
jgi:CBS domain-containing protein